MPQSLTKSEVRIGLDNGFGVVAQYAITWASADPDLSPCRLTRPQ